VCSIFASDGCVVMYGGCFEGMYLILVLLLGCWIESEVNSYMILSVFYWWCWEIWLGVDCSSCFGGVMFVL